MSDIHNKILTSNKLTTQNTPMKEPFPWEYKKDSNPPKFFFNFIGPDSDEIEYIPECPETDLSLGHPFAAGTDQEPVVVGAGSSSASRETNLLGVMDRGYDVSGRRYLWPSTHIRPDPHARPDPLSALRRRFEREQNRLLMPAPSNVVSRRNDVAQLPAVLAASPHPHARPVLSLLGSGSSSQRREVMVAESSSSRRARDEGSSSSNLSYGKRYKAAAEGVETVVIPQRMPHDPPNANGGSGSVVMKGFVKKHGPNEPVTIVCLCHDKAHSAEAFIKHASAAGGGDGGSSTKSTCYVTVSRGIPIEGGHGHE